MLAALLDRAYRPHGLHVTTIAVGGGVSTGSDLDPDKIAETYWKSHGQRSSEWSGTVRRPAAVSTARSRQPSSFMRTVSHAIPPPTTAIAAAISIAVSKPAEKAPGPTAVPAPMPAAAGRAEDESS